jgi:hypothetical protein
MPCVNSSNGQPVPGAQGQCPMGSTWIPDSDAFASSAYQGEDDKPLQNVGDWFSPGGVAKAGLGLAAASPFIKGGLKYAKDKVTDPNNLKRLQALKNKLFKRFDKPERPKYPIMNKNQQSAWDKANPGKWLYDKYKLAGWGGAGGYSLTELMQRLGDDEETVEKTRDVTNQKTKGSRAKALSDADAQLGARYGMTSEPTKMQKLGANMKNPEWWSESISGLPSDNRLMRLGQLMDYYGKTPKGRKDSTAPSELWAANEVAHGKNVAAATDKPDSYKWSYKNVNEALSEWYDDKFGTDWWGGKDGDKLKNKFMNDVTDEKARYPTKNLKQIAEQLLKEYPEEYL